MNISRTVDLFLLWTILFLKLLNLKSKFKFRLKIRNLLLYFQLSWHYFCDTFKRQHYSSLFPLYLNYIRKQETIFLCKETVETIFNNNNRSYCLTEQKPWNAEPPTPQTIVLVMGTDLHLLIHCLCDSVVTFTSCSLAGKVLLSPTSPQPAVRHLLVALNLLLFSGITCTTSLSWALSLSCDGD